MTSTWKDLCSLSIPADVLEKLPEQMVREGLVLPVKFDPAGKVLTVAVKDPADLAFIDCLRYRLKCEIQAIQAPAEDIKRAVEHHYNISLSVIDEVVADLAKYLRENEDSLNSGTFRDEWQQRFVAFGRKIRDCFVKPSLGVPLCRRLLESQRKPWVKLFKLLLLKSMQDGATRICFELRDRSCVCCIGNANELITVCTIPALCLPLIRNHLRHEVADLPAASRQKQFDIIILVSDEGEKWHYNINAQRDDSLVITVKGHNQPAFAESG